MPKPLILPQRLVEPVSMKTQALYDRWVWRHRGRYMRIWTECMKEKMGGADSRMYAKLEIVRLVESGQLSSDMSDITPLDDVSKDPLIPKVGAPTVPSEDSSDRSYPSDDEALDAITSRRTIEQVIGPLAPNPAHAPLKLKPRAAALLINNRCASCGGIDPCHRDWCSFTPNATIKSLIPPIPSDTSVHTQCLECNYMPPYHTQWCTTGHRIRAGGAATVLATSSANPDPTKSPDFIGPRILQPGDKIPARYPFLKDRTVPYAGYGQWTDADELNWGRYSQYGD